jgi:protein TonB
MQNKKKKSFIRLPEYPGGKSDFKEYVKSNLQYPVKALETKTEGTVFLSAEIDDNGNVSKVTVEQGIGNGCDEEAVRLIKGIKFGGVKNRGIRVKTTKKFRINFTLPKSNVTYNYVKNKIEKHTGQQPKKYSYTIQISKNEK